MLNYIKLNEINLLLFKNKFEILFLKFINILNQEFIFNCIYYK